VGGADTEMAPARKFFGTDGIRGVANREPITCETALRVGRALVHSCQRSGVQRPRIVVGRDTRLSGDMLERALTAGVCSAGGDALLAGIVPTPAVAYLTRTMQAHAGTVVSASHNPFQDNGLKFFDATGFKLPDAAEQSIERLLVNGDVSALTASATALGTARRIDDAGQRYIEFLETLAPPGTPFKGMRVVIDCAHGAAYSVGPDLLRRLGADVVALGTAPDGMNINHDVGATHPQRLQATVRAEQADAGVALDGDADRLILADEQGDIVDGDEVLAIAAADMLARGSLKHGTVVATVMSNLGLEVALHERGARLVRVPVGDRYVVAEMRQHGYNLGGEQSGHLIFLDHGTTGDGLLAALQVLRLIVERQRPLSELKHAMTRFPQVLLNVPVQARRDLDGVEPVQQAIARIRAVLNDRGRVLVRYSGTEPLVRVMVEGEDGNTVQAYAEELAAAIRAALAS
jgi:phosphoglucosamine mutase